jgi:alpha-ketoglutarate-dependent 2,4-dichlorophenoxyacetate dioxygenase
MLDVRSIGDHSEFAAEVGGVKIASGVSPEDFTGVRDALDRYAVVVLRDQLTGDLDRDARAQLEFAQMFGALDSSYIPSAADRGNAHPSYGEVSNVTSDGSLWAEGDRRRWFLMANFIWHSDTSFKPVPTWVTLLSAHEAPPEGGDTEFCDLRRAYDDLSPAMKARIEPLRAMHSIFHSRGQVGYTDFTDEERAAAPPVPQPLVRTNARTGRKSLYLSSHASHIVGMDDKDGSALLQELTDFATQPQYCYPHKWRNGDIAIWDNGCTMHRATPFPEFKYRRVMKRTSVNEPGPLLA